MRAAPSSRIVPAASSFFAIATSSSDLSTMARSVNGNVAMAFLRPPTIPDWPGPSRLGLRRVIGPGASKLAEHVLVTGRREGERQPKLGGSDVLDRMRDVERNEDCGLRTNLVRD